MTTTLKEIPRTNYEDEGAAFWPSHYPTEYIAWDQAEVLTKPAISEKENFARAKRAAERKYFLAADLFLKSSVAPIFDWQFEDPWSGERVDRLGIAGSASFLSVEGRSFFVTAGHVINETNGFILGTRSINASNSIEEVVSLPPVWFTTPAPSLNPDPDVAICEVDNAFLPNFTRLTLGQRPIHNCYDIAGFMAKDATQRGDFKLGYILSRIGLVLAPAKHRKYFGFEQIKAHNLVLSYSRISRPLPEFPIGISGGPVVSADFGSVESGKHLEFKYQGLITRRGKANIKLFVCTSSDFIEGFIRQIYFDGPEISKTCRIELRQPPE